MRKINKYTDSPGCKLTLLNLSFGLVLIVFWSTTAWSFESVETEEGAVLQKEDRITADDYGILTQNVRDPFNWDPLVLKKNRVQARQNNDPLFWDFQLSGILWDEKSPIAIIDETMLKEGDMVKGAVVRAIYRDEVLLEQENEYHTLRFKELYELSSEGKSGSKK